jgi:hypothetical protein
MALATLSIDLVAKLANFEKDLGRAAAASESTAKRIAASVGAAGLAIGAALGVGSVTAIGALLRAQVDAIDGFNDLKDATGASIENISGLDDLARRTGVSFDTAGAALVKFNAALKDAKADSEQAKVFKAIGLDVAELKRLDPAEAMRLTAVALNQFADDGEKARAVQVLFGKSLQEVAPLLKDLGEAGKLNATVTTQQAEEAEKLNKQLFALQANANDAGRAIVKALVPHMLEMIQYFKDASAEGEHLVITLLKIPNALKRKALGLKPEQTNGYTNARKEVEDIGALLAGDTSLSQSERTALSARRDGAKQQLAGYLNSTAGAGRGVGAYADVPKGSIVLPPDVKKERTKAAKDDKEYLVHRAQWLKSYDEQLEAEKVLAVKAERLAQDLIDRLSLDATDALSRKIDSMGRATAATADLNAELDRLSGRPDQDRKRALTEQLEARLNAGEIFSPEELDRIVRGIGGVSAEVGKASDVAGGFANACDSMEDALVSFVQTGKLDFKSLVDSMVADLLRLQVKQSVTGPLLKFLEGGFGLGGGGGDTTTLATGDFSRLDRLTASANGNIMTSSGPVALKKYANGGVATSPQLSVFGEGRMPEAYVPLPDGRSIPVKMKGGGGGGRPLAITYNIHTSDMVNKQELQEHLRASERRTVAAYQRSMNYGGA